MIQTIDPVFLLASAGFFLGGIAGFVMQRADFCIAGMFRDLFLFRSTRKLRPLVIAVAVSMVLFEAGRLLGIMRPYPFPLIGSPSFANFIGGIVFGIGMVLAGGCVVGTLYKMGSGSILSMTAFCGLIIGSGIYAEIHPWWSRMAARMVFFKGNVTVPQTLGVSSFLLILVPVMVALLMVLRWQRLGQLQVKLYAEGALQPWKAALIIAALGGASYAIIGMPFGITTSYAKIAGFFESFLFPEHFRQLAYFSARPLNYTNLLTDFRFTGGPAPVLDGIALAQLPVIGGIILGSAFSALLLKEFRITFRVPVKQYMSVLAGGIIMGVASRIAPACNIWHILGGLPILAWQSILFTAGLLPGAWIGSIILSRLVITASSR